MGGILLVSAVAAAAITWLLPLVPINFSGNRITGFIGNTVIIAVALFGLKMFRGR
jgi:tellurite resistance protein TehA-like permease